jgi:hypothetical protein
MKKITIIALAYLFTLQAMAQKEIKFGSIYETVDGDVITTLHTNDNGQSTGTKEIYSYKNTLWKMFTFTELSIEKNGSISSIYKFSLNFDNIDNDKCYITERNTGGYDEKQLFAVQIGVKKATSVVVQSMIGSDTNWNYTKEPIALIYCTSKEVAEKVLAEILNR